MPLLYDYSLQEPTYYEPSISPIKVIKVSEVEEEEEEPWYKKYAPHIAVGVGVIFLALLARKRK